MTNTTEAGEQVLKADVLGRMKTPAARREQLLDEFEHSGLSGKKFTGLGGNQVSDLCDLGAETAATTRRVSGSENAEAIALVGGSGGRGARQ